MKIAAVVCNAVLFVVTCFIVLTKGIPRQASYLILTVPTGNPAVTEAVML